VTDTTGDTADLGPEFTAPEPVEKDKRGSLMSEGESREQFVEGMKLAADGARHIARHRSPNDWNRVAQKFDSLRKAAAKEFNRPQDQTDSAESWGGEGMSFTVAHSRMMDGLKRASAACRQIAQAHRKDWTTEVQQQHALRWNRFGWGIDAMQDQVRGLARKGSVLRTDAGWRNTGTGLVVPARLH
jgi:hypothetical protein